MWKNEVIWLGAAVSGSIALEVSPHLHNFLFNTFVRPLIYHYQENDVTMLETRNETQKLEGLACKV